VGILYLLVKKSAEQKRRAARKKRGAKLSEKPRDTESPILADVIAANSSPESKANNYTEDRTAQKNQDSRFAGKTFRMSIFLSVLALAVFGFLASVAIANWQKGSVWPALWWGMAAYLVFGAGAIFTYYYSVIQPIEAARKAPEPAAKERPFVFVKHISLEEPLSVGREPAVVFIVANSGSMEAEVRIWDCGSYFEPSNGRGAPPMYSKTAANVFSLAPTAEATVRIRIPSLNLRVSEIKQIMEGQANLYFFARGQYKDELNRIWEFPFCRKYSPTFPGNVINCPDDFKIQDVSKPYQR
jgi:hypothetical protein